MIEYLPMDNMLRSVSKVVATVFFVGFIPFAPGTFGTLACMIFIWVAKPSVAWQLIILIATLLIGIGVSGIAEKAFGQKDCGHIVIDEFVGYLCSIIFLPLTPTFMIAAFFLFRFFDILKPPPIRMFEKLSGGYGIMFDDVAAGIITNMLLQIVRLL
jgi:phosphatidylglycerophosphatase A